jgi:hypothetical protein
MRFLERAVRVTSIRLTTTVPRQVTASCAAAARKTQQEVVCPPLVPARGVVSNPELYGPQIVNRRSYSVSINNGQNPGRIHWVFDRSNWAAPPSTHPAHLIGKRDYLGHVISLYRFPDQDGQLEGHDAAFATKRGVSYFVSIHGHTHDDGDIAMLLAILARTS